MKLNCNSFFDGKFEYLNLNDFYLQNKSVITDTKKPELIQSALDSLKKNTYGGYGEDRKDVWAGTYMDEHKNYIHLGIDINVKTGTEVKCPFNALVIDIFTDTDTKIGWGGRVTLVSVHKPSPMLVLAHLDPKSLNNKRRYAKGEVIGRVGTWPTNGNTFHHLHVQAMNKLTGGYDGYGFEKDLANSPNPFEVDFL